MKDHVDLEDKKDGVTIRDSIGRNQKPTVINESGLYSLILSSKIHQIDLEDSPKLDHHQNRELKILR